jgi:hypothetical protein
MFFAAFLVVISKLIRFLNKNIEKHNFRVFPSKSLMDTWVEGAGRALLYKLKLLSHLSLTTRLFPFVRSQLSQWHE